MAFEERNAERESGCCKWVGNRHSKEVTGKCRGLEAGTRRPVCLEQKERRNGWTRSRRKARSCEAL